MIAPSRATLGAAALLSLPIHAAETDLLATLERLGELTANIEVEGAGTVTLQEAMELHGAHGVSVVPIDQGLPGGQIHLGVENVETGARTSIDTVYQAASLSKLVVGLGMAKADHEGLMSLDTSLAEHVRGNPDGVLAGWHARTFLGDKRSWDEDITLRRLLQHSAGTNRRQTGTSCDVEDTRTEAFLGESDWPVCAGCVDVVREPGTRLSYSSGGYVVAEAMFEEHSGRSERHYLKQDVLEPYDMHDSTFRNSTSGVAHLATACDAPHTLTGICACRHEVAAVKFPGGLLAHPLDYARLLVLIMNDGRDIVFDRQIIEPSIIEQVLSPSAHKDSSGAACSNVCAGGERCVLGRCVEPLLDEGKWRGLGTNMTPDYVAADGLPAELFHSGGQDGFSTYFNIDRVERNGVVIFINGPIGTTTRGRKALRRDIIDAFKCVYRDECG